MDDTADSERHGGASELPASDAGASKSLRGAVRSVQKLLSEQRVSKAMHMIRAHLNCADGASLLSMRKRSAALSASVACSHLLWRLRWMGDHLPQNICSS